MKADFEDLRQSDGWAEYLSQLGWLNSKLETLNSKLNIYVRKLPLIGSVVKIQRPTVVPAVGEIDRIARSHRALFVKLEPSFARGDHKGRSYTKALHGFGPDTWTLLPTRTIHIDLTPSEEEILASFSKDARYSVRKAGRDEVSTQLFSSLAPGDRRLEEFHRLLFEIGRRKRFYVAPFKHLRAKVKAFKNKSSLIFAYYDEEPVAGALILFHDSVAYYHHAASSSQGRELLAAYLIVWEAIKLAKKRGCHTFDLEGIYDPRYKVCRRLKALSIFKRKFGGEEITFPGSFVRYYNPIIKLAFRVASKFS